MQEKVLAKMTSGIAVELVSELHGAWLDNVWWLHSVRHSHFMVQLALAFDPALYTPQERVKELDRLFVVRRGVCMHGVKVLTKDQCWNLDFMLLQGHLRRLRTTIAISYLHVLFLRRDMLNQTLEYFPKDPLRGICSGSAPRRVRPPRERGSSEDQRMLRGCSQPDISGVGL